MAICVVVLAFVFVPVYNFEQKKQRHSNKVIPSANKITLLMAAESQQNTLLAR